MFLYGSRMVRRTVLSLSAVAIAACGDFAGIDRETSDDAVGTVAVTMQQMSGGQTAPAAAAGASDANAMPIDFGTVQSLTIYVTSIHFLPAVQEGDGENGDGQNEEPAWVVFDLSEPVAIDLLELPTEGESPLVIASMEIEAGDYQKVRLLVGDANVVFADGFTVGQAHYEAETEYPVTVPSGAQTGIKTDLSFTVEADQDGNPLEVGLLFDPDGTFPHAVATGSGKVILTPVFHKK